MHACDTSQASVVEFVRASEPPFATYLEALRQLSARAGSVSLVCMFATSTGAWEFRQPSAQQTYRALRSAAIAKHSVPVLDVTRRQQRQRLQQSTVELRKERTRV
jgi:hypothetical protein